MKADEFKWVSSTFTKEDLDTSFDTLERALRTVRLPTKHGGERWGVSSEFSIASVCEREGELWWCFSHRVTGNFLYVSQEREVVAIPKELGSPYHGGEF